MKLLPLAFASLALGSLGAAAVSRGCNAQILDNPFSQYLERGITISPGAGNAKDANAAIHTIDPWPPYVGNTRIPGTGRGAVNAVEQMYRTPDPFQQSGSTGFGPTASPGSGAPTTPGASTGVPMQPISGGY